ncbi:MAG: thioredoxin family protein [Chitinophagales bacterium]
MNYESHIQGNRPVVIDFFAEWSQPSKLMAPIFQEVKEKVGERAAILNIDVEKEQELAEFHNIQTVPTLIIFHKGQAIWRKNGISSAHEILEHLQSLLD